jgi:hypothetical protein
MKKFVFAALAVNAIIWGSTAGTLRQPPQGHLAVKGRFARLDDRARGDTRPVDSRVVIATRPPRHAVSLAVSDDAGGAERFRSRRRSAAKSPSRVEPAPRSRPPDRR